MTMVAAASCRGFAVMVSDRLVTLSRNGAFAGRHDPLANKTIVYLGRDGLLILGYTGSAYLDGIPTDEWIAQVLWGRPFERNPDGSLPTALRGKGAGPRGLNQVLLVLRRRLGMALGGRGVTVMATGWRSHRGRLYPLLVSFSGADDGLASSTMSLRRPRTRELAQEVIGVQPTRAVIDAAVNEPRPQPTNGYAYADYVVSIFTSVIRRTAAFDRTVGPHVMAVTVPHPTNRRITCRFDGHVVHMARFAMADPSLKMPVAFTPWLVSEFGYNSAMVMSGLPSVKTKFREWTVEFLGCPDRPSDSGPAFLVDQRRSAMPGRGRQP